MRRNQRYAELHGYDYIFENGKDEEYPCYWMKVHLMVKYMKQYDIVVWLDSDAVIHKLGKPITDYWRDHPNKSFIGCNDPPIWRSPFMAAFFMVKNDPTGIQLMNEWLELFKTAQWKKNITWTCQDCIWAGSSYEQGSFVERILPKYKNSIHLYPYYYFHQYRLDTPHEDTFSYHFAGEFKRHISEYCTLNNII